MKLKYSTYVSKDDLALNRYDVWESKSIPLGNGHFGASLFGNPEKERIQITENSLCNPYDFDLNRPKNNFGLQSFCDIYIYSKINNCSTYSRELDLEKALYSVSFNDENGECSREAFMSYPDNILVYRFKSSSKRNYSISIGLPYLHGVENSSKSRAYTRSGKLILKNNTIAFKGMLDFYKIEYAGYLKVINANGKIAYGKEALKISNTSDFYLIFSCKTNYKLSSEVFIKKREEKLSHDSNLLKDLIKRIEKISEYSYDVLKKRQYIDYSSLFKRVSLSFGEEDNGVETDLLISEYKQNKRSKYLEALLYQYGRYLLICSSRTGCLPANLQGIWSSYDSSPWSSGYWHNINVQMNYWLIGPSNLSELFLSYSDYALAYMSLAKEHATNYIKKYYPEKLSDDNGWIIGTGGWPYLIEGMSETTHSGPGTGGFTALLFYDYYAFTLDKEYLKDVAYPILLGMSKFLDKTLIEINGKYLVKYSASPENVEKEDSEWNDYHKTTGCAFDQQMVYECFDKTIKASEVLNINDEFILSIKEKLNNLEPIIIGKSGQVKEYREEEYYGDFGEKHHRHVSQLVGLYPGTMFNLNDKELTNAAKYTLNARGDKSTGWAMMHRLCMWARLGCSDKVYNIIDTFIKNNVLDNLWDSHPPFQIDGNFGYVAGINEMLVQSHLGYINLLPTIENIYSDISFKGLKARGNFEIDLEYKDNKIVASKIVSCSGGNLKILNKDYLYSLDGTNFIECNSEFINLDTVINDIIYIKSK